MTDEKTPSADTTDIAEQLTKLAKLHTDGVLSDDEFKTLKGKLISGISVNDQSKKQIVDDTGLVFGIYILYFVGYFTGITMIVGAIIAHIMQAHTSNPILLSHYTFQVRTFWMTLLYLFVGALLFYFIIGGFILLWWLVWSLVRNTKGILALNRSEPIANPESWMFGN